MKRFREGEQSRYRTFWLETNVITMAVLRWTKANRLQWHSWFNCAAVELSMGQEQFKVSWLLQTQLNQDGTKEEVKTPRRQVSSMNRKTKWNGKVFLKGTSKGLKQSQREKSDKYINKNKKNSNWRSGLSWMLHAKPIWIPKWGKTVSVPIGCHP